MKYIRFAPLVSVMVLILCAAVLVGCGAGHPTISSITVSPQQATGTARAGKVIFTATGHFTDNTSRQLTVADGLTWKTSDTTTATIDDNGGASCLNNGTVTITATAPQNLNVTIGQGFNNTSTNVSGTATLKCLLAGF